VIEVTPELIILWAGKYEEARQLGRHAIEWFKTETPTENAVKQFLDAHYRQVIPDFSAIVAPAGENWFYVLGNVQRGGSPCRGNYAVCGTGAKLFQELAGEPRYHEGDESPDLTALRLTNDLDERNLYRGDNLFQLWSRI
jgi:hypothetical protein